MVTTPETLCGAMRLVMEDLIKDGKLSMFIVDEAHLLAEWFVCARCRVADR